ncbi:prephenate dehydrogenase [Rubidibacter lacunae KORDI 51-2]|uniref:Prephenate dehydrogenase n=1 Tax=Rubidibacter lacunae KORDI 51-2 TaxID=582515 RepID=U5DLP4_9CHRO|nr:prephenate/arogenate dehydrogenase [Rubidibacter lacunae]ERN41812.1 prephenate dehydrogenase [Rubidibacter lacunae KORDI 51-2]
MDVGIVGLGSIGGSLGLDLRDRGCRVFGVSRRSSTCETALHLGAVDRAGTDLSLLGQTDVVFVCTPIDSIAPTVEQLVPHVSEHTTITDVGSVKAPVVAAVAPLWPNYVGGHPMAGTEHFGIDAARRDLFVGAPYVLTPSATTLPHAIQCVEALARSLGSHTYRCAPDVHDRAVAWISHLPLFVSAATIATCLEEPDTEVLRLARAFASSGFRDTTRVGGGNPELGVMVARHNRDALLDAIAQYRRVLDRLTDSIANEDWNALANLLQRTRDERLTFLRDRPECNGRETDSET